MSRIDMTWCDLLNFEFGEHDFLVAGGNSAYTFQLSSDYVRRVNTLQCPRPDAYWLKVHCKQLNVTLRAMIVSGLAGEIFQKLKAIHAAIKAGKAKVRIMPGDGHFEMKVDVSRTSTPIEYAIYFYSDKNESELRDAITADNTRVAKLEGKIEDAYRKLVITST